MKHYSINIVEAPDPTGMATASGRVCIACKQILTGRGGGGTHICEPCLNALYKAPFRGNLRVLRDATPEQLAKCVEVISEV